ncbi:Phage gp6-like head-tail connector protein [Popillia japonica]|uniref:Phage gp6-like head-tail connector protein n=1 Tax=Popillia japonica TaxID=7064 RepID=A0AAW1HSR0_POPJA
MDDILTNAKLLSGIGDSTHDELLTLYVSMVVQSILNYCNRVELPDELRLVAAQMVVQSILNYCNRVELPDELRLVAAQMVADMYSQNNTADGKTGGVSSVSEAGRTVSFNSSSVQSLIDYKLAERKEQLNNYRLLYRERKG